MAGQSYDEVLSAAIADLLERGFVSAEQLAIWQARLRQAAEGVFMSTDESTRRLEEALRAAFRQQIDNDRILQLHPGVSRFTYERLKPTLRQELSKRIYASADLIKLNKKRAVEDTIQRFSGWATSMPTGGVDTESRRDRKAEIKKPMQRLRFEERRVIIDQSAKMIGSLNEIIAQDGGAIAGRWRSHWRQPNYNYREDHRERDQQVYLLRESWAKTQGLVKPGDAGYYDQITAVGQEVYCRCWMVWIYSLSALPAEMLTEKGRAAIAAGRAKLEDA